MSKCNKFLINIPAFTDHLNKLISNNHFDYIDFSEETNNIAILFKLDFIDSLIYFISDYIKSPFVDKYSIFELHVSLVSNFDPHSFVTVYISDFLVGAFHGGDKVG